MSREWVDNLKPYPRDCRWVMRCDRYIDDKRCPTEVGPPSFIQPSLERFIEAGWFVAEKHGDVCPACLASGYVPTATPHPLMEVKK